MAERRKNDAYYTRPEDAEAVVRTLPLRGGETVLEPSCGGGAFVRPLLALGCDVYAVDIERTAPGLLLLPPERRIVADFAEPLPAHWPKFDAVVGNPPFSVAVAHVKRAHEVCRDRGMIAFVLRVGFMETIKRRPFWRDHPLDYLDVLDERLSFTDDGNTDSTLYGILRWRKGNTAWPDGLGLRTLAKVDA